MMSVSNDRIDAWQVQMAIARVLQSAKSQADAQKGSMAAAVSILIATQVPERAVEYLRDLADIIERDEVLPRSGEVLQ